VFPAMKRVRQNVPALADRSLVSLAQVLARFDWPDKRMLRKISHELREPRRFLRIHPNMFIVVLNAYAKLRVRDVALLEAICGLLARGCNQLSPRSCAEAANSLGRLGVRGPVWAELATKVQEQVDRHGPLQLALIAHGFGKAAVREEKLLMESLAEASLAVIPGFSAKHLACLLDGFVLMGCLHQELFSEAMDESVRIGSVGGRERHQMMSRVYLQWFLKLLLSSKISLHPGRGCSRGIKRLKQHIRESLGHIMRNLLSVLKFCLYPRRSFINVGTTSSTCTLQRQMLVPLHSIFSLKLSFVR